MNSIATKVSRLRAQRLFASVSDGILTSVNVRFATFAPGDALAHHGDKNSPLLLLASGRAQAARYSEDGREFSIAFIRPGDSVGEAAIVLGCPAMCSVIAVTTVIAGLVDRAEARRLFDNSCVSKALLKRLANKLESVVDNQAALTLPSAYARTYSAILAALRESPAEAAAQLELPPHAAIALAANVSRETVSRAMKTLVARGAIAKVSGRFRLTDRRVLHELAAES
ncbi:Crp/Fnr family transcriptional regulator [Cupriavidus necator]|uniref:Crp/Fnr family transcriptional regulator n=1 Tax=Cupriavidus necator TaxID=106590 RepID=A0A1U9UUW0_CUPNE|nr:Crp/Fnr family transcriptional regulator [Cupriavidus necator]AQV96476.1 Crp/Fnr family transcriptional regulator [Cupriavidus necator]